MTSSLYGRLVGATHVEDAALGVLRTWMPTYLNEIARQSGETPGAIARPKSYRVSAEVEKMPEDQTPCVVIASRGVADIPLKNASRQYTAQFILELAAVVSAIGGQEMAGTPRALRLARFYALALRACMAQQSDSDLMVHRDWLGEQYDVLDSIDDRTICVGKVRFAVEVPDVLTADAGPIYPVGPDAEVDPLPESPEWPVSSATDIDLQKVPLDEPFDGEPSPTRERE